MSLSKAAQRVRDALLAKGVEARIVELASSTRTVEDAAKSIGCQAAQIVKSLIFRTRDTARPILVLASGINRVNENAIAEQVGEKITKADADFARETTGFSIGGIPPVGHKQAIITFIDKDLLVYAEVWAAAGTPNAVFCVAPSALQGITDGKVIALS